MRKTDWFPANVKPVRVGVYEAPGFPDEPDRTYFSYFDGKGFCGQWYSPDQAMEMAATPERREHWKKSGSRVYRWRGLTSSTKSEAA